MQKASKGRIVLAVVDPRINNGDDEAVALITKTLETENSDEQRVNLRVLLDTGADQRLSNVLLLDSRPEDDEDLPEDIKTTRRIAFWPPRH